MAEPTSSTAGETLTLYVCHGDDQGPRVHPCRRVKEKLQDAGVDYEKVIAADGGRCASP